MGTQNIDVRRNALTSKWKWALGLIGAVIISPIVFLAVKGLVGLMIAGALALVITQFAPVFGQMIANAALKTMKGEAARNPIETMQNLYADKMKSVAAEDERIVTFEGRLGDYNDKVLDLKRRYPDEATRYTSVADKMQRGLEIKKRKQREAKLALKDYHDQIDKAEALWEMANATADIMQSSESQREQVYADIRSQVAFDSVNHKLNVAVAALNSMDDDTDAAEGIKLLSGDSDPSIAALPRASVKVASEK